MAKETTHSLSHGFIFYLICIYLKFLPHHLQLLFGHYSARNLLLSPLDCYTYPEYLFNMECIYGFTSDEGSGPPFNAASMRC